MMKTAIAAVLAVALVSAAPLGAQGRQELQLATQIDIGRATDSVRSAEAAGAPLHTPSIYDEAVTKLNWARTNLESKSRDVREQAKVRAVEAYYAARASEEIARLVSTRAEASNLRENVVTLGGTIQPVTFADADVGPIVRGGTTRDRVAFAQLIYDRAIAAGARVSAPEDMKTAESTLDTARKILKNQNRSETAEHLAYVAEMLSRRAEAIVLRRGAESLLPGLRQERTRLAQAAAEMRARQEEESRAAAERQAEELRRRLEAEEANRRADAEELQRLRDQIVEHDLLLQQQLSADRTARLDAERRLDELRVQYQSAVTANSNFVELEQLRRQVEDQELMLRAIRERERSSEAAMAEEIDRLRKEIDEQRSARGASADALASKDEEIRRREEELQRMRATREDSERQRAEQERAYLAAIEQGEQRRRAVEEEAAALRQQVTEERARAQAAEAQLTQVQAEVQRRDEMLRALSQIAQTRTDPRGLVVTLPGIFFATGQATLTAGAKNALARIATELKNSENLRVEIEGHTDSVGSDESNLALSERRANAVRDYLVSQGLSVSTMTVRGLGEGTPVASNTTASGRQQNRRVELVIATK